MLESFKPNPLYSPQNQETQTVEQAQTSAPVSSLTGGVNPFWKPEEQQEVQQNKNSRLGVLGRTLVTLPQSIGKGLTDQLDKISDTPANVRNALAQKDAEVLKDFGSWHEAQKSQNAFQYHSDTHLLGQDVKDWEQRVDQKQQAILDDNPTSKLAKAGTYVNELGESVGAMIPTIAASALTGGLMSAAAGGSAALGAKAAMGVKSAADTLGTISAVSEAAGLGTMFMGVYSKSLEDAVAGGADYNAAAKKALGDATLEVLTEKMFAGIAGLGRTGFVSSAAKKAAASAGAENLVKAVGVKKAGLALANMVNGVTKLANSSPVANLLFDALGEGAEEMVAEFFGPYIERATTNPYAENATIEQILQAGLGGALISFAMNPVGKITANLAGPSEDAVAKARMEFRTTNPDQVLANMATLTFQEVSSPEDITAIENILGRKLEITPLTVNGKEVGSYAGGIANSQRQRQAVEAMREAIDAGKTPQAMQTLREKMSAIWDAEVQERQDNAGAIAFADKVSEDRLNSDKKYQSFKNKLSQVEKAYADALDKADELETAAAEKDATDDVKKNAEKARKEADRLKLRYEQAQNNEAYEKKRIRRDVEYKLTEEQVRKEYGDELIDNFTIARRVMQNREGQAYIEGQDGVKHLFNRYEYAEDLGGRYYSKAERSSENNGISENDRKISEKVDKTFDKYTREIRKELKAFKDRVNESLVEKLGKDEKGNPKLRVNIVNGNTNGDIAYYSNGVITFNSARVTSDMAAQFLLAHEILHGISDKFMSEAQFNSFGEAVENSMKAIGFDYDEVYGALSNLYGRRYLAECLKEAEKKKFKTKEETLDYAAKLSKRKIQEEVYARFMSVAFGSDDILQSLALVSPEYLRTLRDGVETSSIKNLPNTLWNYTRLKVLDRIDKALASPVDPEDVRDGIEIDKEMAFAKLSDEGQRAMQNLFGKEEYDEGLSYDEWVELADEKNWKKTENGERISPIDGEILDESDMWDTIEGAQIVLSDWSPSSIKRAWYLRNMDKLGYEDLVALGVLPNWKKTYKGGNLWFIDPIDSETLFTPEDRDLVGREAVKLLKRFGYGKDSGRMAFARLSDNAIDSAYEKYDEAVNAIENILTSISEGSPKEIILRPTGEYDSLYVGDIMDALRNIGGKNPLDSGSYTTGRARLVKDEADAYVGLFKNLIDRGGLDANLFTELVQANKKLDTAIESKTGEDQAYAEYDRVMNAIKESLLKVANDQYGEINLGQEHSQYDSVYVMDLMSALRDIGSRDPLDADSYMTSDANLSEDEANAYASLFKNLVDNGTLDANLLDELNRSNAELDAALEADRPRWAFARLSDNYHINPVDKMYSKVERALNTMSLNDFKSVFNSDEALVNALTKYGVKKEEIEYSRVTEFADELRGMIKDKVISAEEAKSELADLVSGVFTDKYTGALNETVLGEGPYTPANWRGYEYNPNDARDYREYLYEMPGNTFKHMHWPGHKGVVVHLRANMRDTTNGEPVFFVEEAQSDLHSNAQRKHKGIRQSIYESESETEANESNRSVIQKLRDERSRLVAGLTDKLNAVSEGAIRKVLDENPEMFIAYDGGYDNYGYEYLDYINAFTGEVFDSHDEVARDITQYADRYLKKDEIVEAIVKLATKENVRKSEYKSSENASQAIYYLLGDDTASQFFDRLTELSADIKSSEKEIPKRGLKAIPDAPYKKDRAQMYAMQRALGNAIKENAKYIAWTTAKMQSDRYDGYVSEENYAQEYDRYIPKTFGKYAESLGGKLTKISIKRDRASGPGNQLIGSYGRLSENQIELINKFEDGEITLSSIKNDDDAQFLADYMAASRKMAKLADANELAAAAGLEDFKDYILSDILYEEFPERYPNLNPALDDKSIEVQAIEITPELKKNIEEKGQPRWAFASFADRRNLSNIDHMYAKSAEVLAMMSDKSFRSAITEPGLFLRNYLRKNGVTEEEIKQTGLIPEAARLWERVRKKEITDAEARRELIERAETEGILDEIVLPDTKKEKSIWSSKTLLGDRDKYAEYLYTLPPGHPGANFESEHFDEPGILVHIRADRRYTTNGDSVFFVEENQSDYHNTAHKKDPKTKERIGSYQDDAAARLEEVQAKIDNAENLSEEEFKALREEERRLISSVPHAYYEKDFAEEYAMKRALLHAIQNGDDYLAWTTPSMQVNRWSDESAKAYRNTYGLRIPGFMDRYVKQWGSKVEKLNLSVSYKGVDPESYNRMASSLPDSVMPTDKDVSPNGTYEVYGVKITPEMRKDVLENGQSRWNFDRFEDFDLSEERLKEYQDLLQKYGGDVIPNRINQHVGTNRTVGRILGDKHLGSRELNTRLVNAVLEGEEGITHIIMTDEAAKFDALKRIRSHKTIGEAFTEADNALTGKAVPNKNDIVFGEQLLVDMAKRYQDITNSQDVRANESKDTTELLNQMQKLIADLCAAGTRAGQNLQAFRLLKKLTPTGRLYYIEAQINSYLSEMVDRKGMSRVGGYRYQKDSKGRIILDQDGKPKAIKISDELRSKMEACKTQEEMDEVEKDIIEDIASQIPPTLTDRIVAWRYLAMLGNPRTHIRNMVSNYAMGIAVRAKDRVGGALEDIFLKDRDVVGRTKTNRRIDPALKKSLEEFAINDWDADNVSEYALSGGKVGFKSKIDERRNKLGYGKFTLLDKASKKNSDWLEKEDYDAARRAYKNAFVSYCAANNLTPEILKSGTAQTNTRLAQARSYAVNEAAKATYHDANALATHLNQIEKMNGASKIIVGGLVPFKKTPANILKRGIEYSPISIVGGIKQFVEAKNLNTDAFIQDRMGEFSAAAGNDKLTADSQTYKSAAEAAKDISKVNGVSKAELRYSAEATKTKMMADALDKLASGLTGTMLMMLGMLLGHWGIMKGAGDENDREEYYNQMLGQQEYSINAFGKNFTMDWLTPVSMPIFTGVELMKMIDEDGKLSFNEALDAVERLADPVMNLSVLQGINQSMSQYESGLGKMVLSAGESYIGQFIPTLAGQIARSIDPTRRTTYAAKEGEGFGGDLEKFRNKLENKIPGLAATNSAYVDMWGRHDEDTDPFVARLIKNSVLPMYIKDQNKTVADDYVTYLLSQTGDRSVIPNSPDSSYTFDGTKVYLMSDEYQATKEMIGQISNVGVTSLMNVSGIESLTAEEQANLVSKVYSFARAIAKMEYANAKGITDYDPTGTTERLYNAVNAGMTIGEAIYVNYVADKFTADYNSKGNAIQGSKKAKMVDFYHSVGLTEEQIKAIIPSSYTYP